MFAHTLRPPPHLERETTNCMIAGALTHIGTQAMMAAFLFPFLEASFIALPIRDFPAPTVGRRSGLSLPAFIYRKGERLAAATDYERFERIWQRIEKGLED